MDNKASTKTTKARRATNLILRGEKVEASSGNVFADLGLPHAEELLAKSQQAISIAQVVEHKGWTKMEAAQRAGISYPSMSNLLRGKLRGFSANQLAAILNRLDPL